jgi:hypothetical protein
MTKNRRDIATVFCEREGSIPVPQSGFGSGKIFPRKKIFFIHQYQQSPCSGTRNRK